MSESKTVDTDRSGHPAPDHASFADAAGGYFTPVAVAFTAVLLISNVCVAKGVQFFTGQHVSLGPITVLPITMDGAFFLFPLAYVIGDILSEVYGFRATRRIVYYGFGALLLMIICFQVVIKLPTGDLEQNGSSFGDVLGHTPQLAFAGIAGYFVGQFLNSITLVLIKERTKEKHLWARLLGSTVAGEIGDTFVFCSIAATAIGIHTWGDYFNYTIVGFVWKTLVEMCVLPISYRCIAFLKKREPSYRPRERSAIYE
ncbi:queuosine precursor transporter [Nocardia tengchongensis]|uniref:Probable queuosine precursor transporter n=1 Tax=Nocardia tengchongensis TaxID=2055889 RepID=A0ABX8CS49_9NOCA|nr:queuosine precursor transporter [Nocardia tengchongensis]QVI22762.1 queuosine precursor transporter [Nocardia tengchongensis]